MRTLVIDQNIYNGAESYAKTHNISLKDFVESIIILKSATIIQYTIKGRFMSR